MGSAPDQSICETQPLWLTTAEVATLAKVTKPTVRSWRLTGKVQTVFANGLHRFSRKSVLDLIASRNAAPDLPTSLPGIGPVITSSEASRRLHVHAGRINQYVQEGRLKTFREVFISGGNNENMAVVLVSEREVQDLIEKRKANGVVHDPGVSLEADEPCPFPEERLVSRADACRILGVLGKNLATWRMVGRIKFDIKRKNPGAGSPYRVFYDREEIEKCKVERDIFKAKERDPEWMDWRQLLEFTGISEYDLRGYIRNSTLPQHLLPLGRRDFAMYHKPEIKEWMREREGSYKEYAGLLHTTQAAAYTGFSPQTMHKYIVAGNLKYKHHRRHTIPILLADKGKIDGRGYWFDKEELTRWKHWMWDRLLSNRKVRGALLERLRKQLEGKHEKGVDVLVSYQNTVSNPIYVVERTPRISNPVDLKEYQAGLISTGDISVELAEALESQIVDSLEDETLLLTPHDLYQLIMGFKHVKEQYRILKQRKIKVPRSAGERLEEALPLVSTRAKQLAESGVGMTADNTYYLTQTARYVQQELLKRDNSEVGDTGEDADDLFTALEEA